MKKIAALLVLFLIVITTPETAFEGCINGLSLFGLKVFPALFAAFLISSCILNLLPQKSNSGYLFIIAAGLLCGFPTGAFCCCTFHDNNRNETLCEKIMAYCNISSPSFMLNYIYITCLEKSVNLITFITVTYVPAIFMIILICLNHKRKISNQINNKIKPDTPLFLKKITNSSKKDFVDFPSVLDNAVINSVNSMLKLGGYIILFSIAALYIRNLLSFNRFLYSIACGIIEITNGLFYISKEFNSLNLRFILTVAINSFGGISTIMQTCGIIKNSGLSIKKYIYHKMIYCLLCTALSIIMVYV